jgi:hypothetical protein
MWGVPRGLRGRLWERAYAIPPRTLRQRPTALAACLAAQRRCPFDDSHGNNNDRRGQLAALVRAHVIDNSVDALTGPGWAARQS